MTLIPVVVGILFVASSAADSRVLGLVLEREYGRAAFRQCRLHVSVFEGRGQLRLQCAVNIRPPKSIEAQRSLDGAEVDELVRLVEAADLYAGGYAGADDTSRDGTFETLRVTCCGRSDVAILVTSRNHTFAKDDARGRLLAFLHKREDELRSAATAAK